MATSQSEKLNAFARQQGYKNYYELRKAKAQAQGYRSLKDQTDARRTGIGLSGSDASNPKYVAKLEKAKEEGRRRTEDVRRERPGPVGGPGRSDADRRTEAARQRLRGLDPRGATEKAVNKVRLGKAKMINRQVRIANDPRYELKGQKLVDHQKGFDEEIKAIGGEAFSFTSPGSLGKIYQDAALAANPNYQLGPEDGSILNRISQEAQQGLDRAVNFASQDARRFIPGMKEKANAVDKKIDIGGKDPRSLAKRETPQQWMQKNLVKAKIYSDGQRHDLGSYAELTMRAAAQRAHNTAVAKASGAEWFMVHDGDGCGWTGHDDPDAANGSVRRLEDVLSYPIAHPNCQRTIEPIFDQGEGPEPSRTRKAGDILAAGLKAQAASLASDLAAEGVKALLTNKGFQARATSLASKFVPGAWEKRLESFVKMQKGNPIPEGVADIAQARLNKEVAQEALVDVQYDLAEGVSANRRVRGFIGVEQESLPRAVGDQFDQFIEFNDRTLRAKMSATTTESIGVDDILSIFQVDMQTLEQKAFEFAGNRFGSVGNQFARFTFPKVGFSEKVSAGRFTFEPNKLINATVTKTQRGIVNHLGFNRHGLLRAGIGRDPETGLWSPSFSAVPKGPIRIVAKVNRSRGRKLIIENLGPGRGGRLGTEILAQEGKFQEVVSLTTDELFQINSLETGDTLRLGDYLYEKTGPDEVLQGRGRVTSVSWEARLVTKTPVNFSARFNFNLRKLGIHNWQDIRNLTLEDFRKLGLSDMKFVSAAAELRAGGMGPFQIAKTFRISSEQAQELWELTNRWVEDNPIVLPKIPEGHVRLWRGEGERDGSSNEIRGVRWTGRWFSTDRTTAEKYVKDGGKLLYVDVPEEISIMSTSAGGTVPGKPELGWLDPHPDALKVSEHPLAFMLDLKGVERFLPEEWADAALSVPNPKEIPQKILEGIQQSTADTIARRRRDKFIGIYGEEEWERKLATEGFDAVRDRIDDQAWFNYAGNRREHVGSEVVNMLTGEVGTVTRAGPSYVTIEYEAETIKYQWDTVNERVKILLPEEEA